MKRVLITGVNSYVGTNVEKWLMNEPNNFDVETIDMQNPKWNEFDFSKFDVVFHVAGIAHVSNKKSMKDQYYKVNRDLAINVAKKAKESKVKQFIFMSSSTVYGESVSFNKQFIIDEYTKIAPSNHYSKSKVEAESSILKLTTRDFNIVIIRSPMIYGKGSKGNYNKISRLSRHITLFPYIDNQRSMIFILNLAQFIKLLIINRESGIFHPQNNEYVNTSEMVKLIALAHGKKIKIIKGFSWLISLFSIFNNRVRKMFGNLTYKEDISKYKENYCLYSLEESIKQTEE